VIVPTYNERDSLPGLLRSLRPAVPEAHVLVVDDSSPDGTGALADAAAKADSHIDVLHRPRKDGLGRAYLEAFAWGLERGFDPLVEMDADGSHPADRLRALLQAVDDGADLAIGSRWAPGGRVVGWPLRRHLLSRGGNWYVARALRLGVADATAGFRAYRAGLLRRIDLDAVEAEGYAFQVNMVMAARDLGARIAEVPITFTERERGRSKMDGRIVREAMWLVTKWGLVRRLKG
jgi:dolichol-phosphate mannosyltransferase